MQNQTFAFYLAFFTNIWRLFTSWEFPGTDVTPASMSLFVLCVSVVLSTLKRLSQIPDGSIDTGSKSNLPSNRW